MCLRNRLGASDMGLIVNVRIHSQSRSITIHQVLWSNRRARGIYIIRDTVSPGQRTCVLKHGDNGWLSVASICEVHQSTFFNEASKSCNDTWIPSFSRDRNHEEKFVGVDLNHKHRERVGIIQVLRKAIVAHKQRHGAVGGCQ